MNSWNASGRSGRFYQKITDIYQQGSIDYDKDAEITQIFFKTVQNKLHWAITKQTAPQIVASHADSTKPNMGLQTWENAPSGKIINTDVTIAKNYLHEKEIKELERVVSMYLDCAGIRILNINPLILYHKIILVTAI